MTEHREKKKQYPPQCGGGTELGTSAVNVIRAFPKLIVGAPTGEVGQGSNFLEARRFFTKNYWYTSYAT